MNCTIVEKIRSMLRMASLTKSSWGEAICIACYLINRSPLVSLGFEILEVWTRKDVFYSHLKVFECKASAHVSKEQWSSLMIKPVFAFLLTMGM